MYLIGVDVGGTFTDIVFADTASGRSLIHKVPTTPDDPSRGVIAAIVELCARHDVPTLRSRSCAARHDNRAPTRCSSIAAP